MQKGKMIIEVSGYTIFLLTQATYVLLKSCPEYFSKKKKKSCPELK